MHELADFNFRNTNIQDQHQLYHQKKDLYAIAPMGSALDKGKEIIKTGGVIENCSMQVSTTRVLNQPFYEFKRPRLPAPTGLITPQIKFVPAVYEQPVCVGTTCFTKKCKKKAKKSHHQIAQQVFSSKRCYHYKKRGYWCGRSRRYRHEVENQLEAYFLKRISDLPDKCVISPSPIFLYFQERERDI